ncbi:hypothetical protein AYI69_g3250 [Smittium culicis]|uniref:Uncharacterized protein n=1 Tax=Smittium culicis TaxID=133412 RepID=A0A1R1YKK1_9FUNG|nr:hypothetical protein AYI69_g3250 [Smittium culicis]
MTVDLNGNLGLLVECVDVLLRLFLSPCNDFNSILRADMLSWDVEEGKSRTGNFGDDPNSIKNGEYPVLGLQNYPLIHSQTVFMKKWPS